MHLASIEVNTISTRLYKLHPIGLGTAWIESQTSYIARLAEAHSVTVGTLIGKEFAPTLGKRYLIKNAQEGGSRFYAAGFELNGFGKAAEDCSKALQTLTGQSELRNLTLLLWNKLFSPRGVLRDHKAWCSACFDEWEKSGQEIYEPLLWNFREAKICPSHGIRLQTRCPNCSSEIPVLSRKLRNGYCSFCGSWLGNYISSTNEVLHTPWESFVMTNLGDLIIAQQIFPQQVSYDHIHAFIKLVVDQTGGKSSFSRVFGFPKTTVRVWYDGKHRPNLESLLRICWGTESQVKDILYGQVLQKVTIKAEVEIDARIKAYPRKKKRTFNYGKVELALKMVILNDQIQPISISELARRLKYDKRLLYRYFPNLCKEISRNYRTYLERCKRERIDKACCKVKEVTIDLYNQGVYPSRRRVESYLQTEILREKSLQRAWRDTLESLGL